MCYVIVFAVCVTDVNSATNPSNLQQVSAIVQDSTHLVFEVDTCSTNSSLLLYEDINDEYYNAYMVTIEKQRRVAKAGVVLTRFREIYSREYHSYEFIKCGKQYLWIDWSFGRIQIGYGQYIDIITRVLEVYIEGEPAHVNHAKITGNVQHPWSLPVGKWIIG